jgi:hypothetical protein
MGEAEQNVRTENAVQREHRVEHLVASLLRGVPVSEHATRGSPVAQIAKSAL